jgi:DNA invertase Pin-like site-specific DNA recombinase
MPTAAPSGKTRAPSAIRARAPLPCQRWRSSRSHTQVAVGFHVFAALAELERDLIRERTAAGLAAARARGRRGGRPSVLAGHKLAREVYRSGQYSVAAIATTLGVSRSSIYRHLDRAGG